jgi:glycerol-3-phosphate cytidylyltransferase
MKTILTYGTFDMFHIGHLNILLRLRELGDRLIVGVSSDEFNESKGKKTFIPYKDRATIVSSLKCVDKVIPEYSWEQKRDDILNYNVSVFGMGCDWKGKFDDLNELCKVIYLPRTDLISTTHLKKLLRVLDQQHISDLKTALDIISGIVNQFDHK